MNPCSYVLQALLPVDSGIEVTDSQQLNEQSGQLTTGKYVFFAACIFGRIVLCYFHIGDYDLEIPAVELQMGKKINAGTYGEVCNCNWRGADVAVKVIRIPHGHEQLLQVCKQEVTALM